MQFCQGKGADEMALRISGMPAGLQRNSSVSEHSDLYTSGSLSRDQRIREAAFLCFSGSCSCSFPYTLTTREWTSLLNWLDVSGLALYFLDQLVKCGQASYLPGPVRDRLERSQEENCERTQGLLNESVRLQREFQSANLRYSVMKGVSLYPASVPRLELRHQFDIDFLIAEGDAPTARQILESHGYALFAISGRSWEFKKGQTPHVAASDLYRDLAYRGVELHLETSTAREPSRLDRVIFREIHGAMMPVLAPIDLFLSQAMHASKDISGPFVRASHLLEFYRHVLAQRDDIRFWKDLRERTCEDRGKCLAIGIVTYLVASVWGPFAPQALTSWTADQLPPPIRLWLDLYGRPSIYQVPPGSKRYLRLRQEMKRAIGASHGSSKLSLPSFKAPRAVIQATPGETLWTRIARYQLQVRFLTSRLRFHLVGGLRFIVESPRWRRFKRNLP